MQAALIASREQEPFSSDVRSPSTCSYTGAQVGWCEEEGEIYSLHYVGGISIGLEAKGEWEHREASSLSRTVGSGRPSEKRADLRRQLGPFGPSGGPLGTSTSVEWRVNVLRCFSLVNHTRLRSVSSTSIVSSLGDPFSLSLGSISGSGGSFQCSER